MKSNIITTTCATWFKTEVRQSSELLDHQKVFMPKGSRLKILEISPVGRQHVYFVLSHTKTAADGITALRRLYAYTPHIECKQSIDKRLIKLDVPYFSQLDNDTMYFGAGSRQCNLTSCAMFLAFLIPELIECEWHNDFERFESDYGETLSKYGDTTNHRAQTRALMAFGVESYFSYTLSLKDLILCLRNGYPVVLGVAYKKSGHIVVATGFNLDKEQIYIHDPYGVRHGFSDACLLYTSDAADD